MSLLAKDPDEKDPDENDPDENWYEELKKIEGVEGVAVRDKLYASVEAAKKLLNYNFFSGYGTAEGPPFTLWTKDRIYFPVQYDGSEWISSVPRNPCDESTEHQGGG